MITLDDKYRLEDFGFICEPGYDDSITPIFERKTYSIPGVEGVIPFGTEVKEKPFAYPLMIMERFHIEMQRKFEKFTDFFFDQYGNPRKVKMVRDYDPSKFYYVELAQRITPDRLPEDGKFVLPLVAHDPRAYSIMDSTKEIHWNDSISWMSDIPISFKKTSYTINRPQSISINNYGSMVVRPVVEIKGSAENFTFTLNGERFSLGTFAKSTFVLDSKHYTAIKNGQNFLFQMQGNLEKLELNSGINSIRMAGSNLNINLDFKFHAKYK